MISDDTLTYLWSTPSLADRLVTDITSHAAAMGSEVETLSRGYLFSSDAELQRRALLLLGKQRQLEELATLIVEFKRTIK